MFMMLPVVPLTLERLNGRRSAYEACSGNGLLPLLSLVTTVKCRSHYAQICFTYVRFMHVCCVILIKYDDDDPHRHVRVCMYS